MKTYTIANKLNTISMLALLWLGSIGVFGQVAQEPDWKFQKPLPTGSELKDVQFIDGQTGWAVGNSGTILKTTNGGSSWLSRSVGTSNHLNTVQFINAQTGWAVGSGGTILKTSNGSSSWHAQSSGTTHELRSIHFADSQTGWVVGDSGTILKTNNGGQSWQELSSGTTNGLFSILFIDLQIGWAVGSLGIILKTSNGGSSWSSQISGTTNVLRSIHFSDSLIGWAVGVNGTIRKTSNGGSSWSSQSSGTSTWLFSVYFSDAQNGCAVGLNGVILKTTNGGTIWNNESIIGEFSLNSVHFDGAQTGWAVGVGGVILKTSNGGSDWSYQISVTNRVFGSVHFIDAQTGWVVGEGGTILKTSNGGSNWTTQSTTITNHLRSVHFIDAQNGWTAGNGGLIMHTFNGGITWVGQNSRTTNQINSVRFIDSLTGWAVGNSGTIRKTSNGGSNWVSQNSGITGDLYSVYFSDPQIGWAVGVNGKILKTLNGGSSWNSLNSGTAALLHSVNFIDAQTGWVVGNGGTIRKTSNGGINWISLDIGPSNYLISIHFIDPQNGWVVGLNGNILKTSNGGINWISQSSGTTNYLNSVYFIDPFHGWAVGEFGTILTTINIIDPETPTSLLQGSLFEKKTANCNPTNIPISGKLVKAMPGPYYGNSQNDGNYSVRVPLEDTAVIYTLQPIVNSNSTYQIETVCPPSGQIQVAVDTIPDTLSGKDFGFEITPCHHLDVQLASNRRRRCFKNTTSIYYGNQGSLSAPDAYLLVEFPNWVRPISASRSYVALNDSVWRFNLDTVSAGESGSFTITDSVICGNVGVLGLSQCTRATIFPAPDCPPQSNWSGAEVSVSGVCQNGFVELGIYNKSSVPMPDSVDYWVYLDSIQVKQAKVKLAAGDSLKLWVEAFGMPVYLTANQVANHPSDVFVAIAVEACNDTTPFFPRPAATRFPIAQRPNSKTQCLPIIGAYDPNDKQAFPIGFTNQNIIAPNTRLEYLVRFQNTGNDTAFTVYVIDTLDQNLNVESFEMGAASHNYQLSMQTVKSGKTFLRWQFNNIQLPDSNTNEPASNGFVQFRISPKAGLALGSKVRNHAEIYFDFNPPIITNQTLTTYDVIVYRDSTLNNNVQIVTASKSKLSPKQIGVNLYPNPVTDHSLTADFETKGSLTLFNAQGQLVYEKQNIESKQVLPIQLRTGFYMAQLRTEKGVSVVKVVVE